MKPNRIRSSSAAAILAILSIFYTLYAAADVRTTLDEKIELSQSYSDRLNSQILHLSTQIVKHELTGRSDEKISVLKIEVEQLRELQSDLIIEISQLRIQRNIASE